MTTYSLGLGGFAVRGLGFIGVYSHDLRWAFTPEAYLYTFVVPVLVAVSKPLTLAREVLGNTGQARRHPVPEGQPGFGPALDALQLLDVYASVWFSSIYLLLFVSLIGCVLPTAKAHYGALLSTPTRTPQRLSRLPEYETMVLPRMRKSRHRAPSRTPPWCKKRGYRVDVRDVGGERPSLGAERGFLEEAGNLSFAPR